MTASEAPTASAAPSAASDGVRRKVVCSRRATSVPLRPGARTTTAICERVASFTLPSPAGSGCSDTR